jgi:hypothetical protein
MTSKKSSNCKRGPATPYERSFNAWTFIAAGVKAANEFERMTQGIEDFMHDKREAAKKILAVALRPTRKRRVDVNQFEFKN